MLGGFSERDYLRFLYDHLPDGIPGILTYTRELKLSDTITLDDILRPTRDYYFPRQDLRACESI